MEITLNNRKELVDQDSITLSELIKLKNFTFKLLVTKINGNLVRKEDRDKAVIKDGDDVTVLHLISGG
jgi:thiamine biosynthesis protein ThiS